MENGKLGFGVLGVSFIFLLSSLIFPPRAVADTWSQTTFPSGTFTNTTTTTNSADVILSKAPLDPVVWSTMAGAPAGIWHGGALCYPGSGDFIYALRGGVTTAFYRYSISGNSWATMASLPGGGGYWDGAALCGSGDFIYCFPGASAIFYRYSISGNYWETMAAPPANTGNGAALCYPGSGDFIYGFQGGGNATFYRYSISGNSWATMAAAPGGMYDGGALAYPGSGDFIYGFQGNNTNPTAFYRYSISGNSWATMAAAPAGINAGGALCYPGKGDFIYSFRGANTTDFYRCQVFGFTSGTYLSNQITPTGVSYWGVLAYTKTTPANTLLTVDVLSSSNNALLVANVPSGTNLQYTYPATFANISGIKLRANLSTTDVTITPQLNDWQVEYATGSNWVNTANWTSIVKAANPVAMGNAVAVISFTAVAGGTITTAHWRRFRIDETGGQPIEKLSVSVYEESGNDGFFDAADKFIASGTFNSNRTCYLNMNRWPLGTTPKTYYIVEKVALDGSGGQTIRLNIVDGSYFDFEEGPCVGVPP